MLLFWRWARTKRTLQRRLPQSSLLTTCEAWAEQGKADWGGGGRQKGAGRRAWAWLVGLAFWGTGGEVGPWREVGEWGDGVLGPQREGTGPGHLGSVCEAELWNWTFFLSPTEGGLPRFCGQRGLPYEQGGAAESSREIGESGAPGLGQGLVLPVATLTLSRPPPPPPPRQVELQELEEPPRKLESSPSLTFSNTQMTLSGPSLGMPRRTSTVPESILSHKTRGRGTGSVSHVTFGDSGSAAGPVTLASVSASGALGSSRGSVSGRGGYRHSSSSSYLGSTGYLETSRGRESVGGGMQSQSMGSELSRGSSSGQASSALPASRPSSSTSKDSRGLN